MLRAEGGGEIARLNRHLRRVPEHESGLSGHDPMREA